MRQPAFLCLLSLIWTAFAAASDFRLGLDYAVWGPSNNSQMAIDGAGELYVLGSCASETSSPSCLAKLSADGKTILWQKNLASHVSAMAIDPKGGIYLTPDPTGLAVVEKLSADGTIVLWKTEIKDNGAGVIAGIAVDATGRAFIAHNDRVIRLNTSGAIDAAFPKAPIGPRMSLAVSPDGSDIVIGTYLTLNGPAPAYTLVRLAPDQTNWLRLSPPQEPVDPGLAVAPDGDAIVYGSDYTGHRSLQRIDRSGNVVFSKSILSNGQAPGNLAIDAAGNAYITGYTGTFGIPTKDTLAPCGSTWMSVYGPDGAILQTTFLPGATSTTQAYPLIAVGQGGAVFVLSQADATFTATLTGPFAQSAAALFHLSPNANAQTLPLGCVASAYSFDSGAIAPGELVALYGNGLGPTEGVPTAATAQTPFPTEAAGVQVTFDGVPAPLLWVQDSQINVAVPWSVAGLTTQICVTGNNAKPNCLTWPVALTAPGVVTWDGAYAAAVNQDGTLNSPTNPAPGNSIVSIFATGLGPINPSLPDGSLTPISPLPVNAYPVTIGVPFRIGVVPAMSYLPADYAGPAPLQIAGASQINFKASDMLIAGANSWLYVEVETPSGRVQSNAFRIYVAAE